MPRSYARLVNVCAERWLHPSAVHVNAMARRGSGGSDWIGSGVSRSPSAFAKLAADELARKAAPCRCMCVWYDNLESVVAVRHAGRRPL
jgi:hypothetical protein